MKRLVLFVPFLSACGVPTEDRVRQEFMVLYPNATVVETVPGEADFENAQFHIMYRVAPDTTLREQVWLYQHDTGDGWKVIHKDSSRAM